jgi:hypothetical protein
MTACQRDGACHRGWSRRGEGRTEQKEKQGQRENKLCCWFWETYMERKEKRRME